MSTQTIKSTYQSALKNERHDKVAETRYWCDQYRMLAKWAIEELESKAITTEESSAVQEPVAWPSTPAHISDFIGSSYVWREHKISDVEPHEDDKYCLTAHDLLEAFAHLIDTHQQPKEGQETVAWHVHFGNEDEPNYVCLSDKPNEPNAIIRPLIFGDTNQQPKAEQERPINCGTSFCSCIECVMEPEPKAKQKLKREWVGLTDEDLSVCDEDGILLAKYWEAKLKEKNTIIQSYPEKDKT